MPTHWKRADDNELREHLQAAIAERETRDVVEKCSYSGHDLAAILEEVRNRRMLRPASQDAVRRADGRAAARRRPA